MHQWEWRIQPLEIYLWCFNAIYAAQNKQTFLFHGQEVETSGNPLAHVILRGALNEYGKNEPNFYYETLLDAIGRYESMGLENPFIMIDTNHDNSGKQYMEQVRICSPNSSQPCLEWKRLRRQFEASWSSLTWQMGAKTSQKSLDVPLQTHVWAGKTQ